MSEIGKAIDQCIGLQLGPVLKKEGFRKSGRTFHRSFDLGTQVVNIQANRWNQGGAGSFTVNLGIYFPDIHRLAEMIVPRALPGEADCTLRQRLGILMPSGSDYWWELDPGSDLERVAAEVGAAWTRYGKPWLDRHSELEEAAKLSTAVPIVRMAIYLHLERREEASSVLQKELARKPDANPAYTASLRTWASENGIPT